MATISIAPTVHGVSNPHRRRYQIEREIDFAEIANIKGSAIAANDVIEALTVDGNTLVEYVLVSVIDEMTGTSSDLAIDVGSSEGDPDAFVDAWDYPNAAAGDYAISTTPIAAGEPWTIDLTVATQTGTFTGGKVRVQAICQDVGNLGGPKYPREAPRNRLG